MAHNSSYVLPNYQKQILFLVVCSDLQRKHCIIKVYNTSGQSMLIC